MRERKSDRQTDTEKQTDKEKQRGRGDGQPDRFFDFKWCVIRESVSFMYKMIDYKYFALLSLAVIELCVHC